MRRLKSRDKSALEYLYDRYSSALYGVVTRIIPQERIAEEVLQDVFLKIWDRIDQYDPYRGRLFTWMHNIARNQAIDKTRSGEYTKEMKTGRMENLVSASGGEPMDMPNVDAIGLNEVLNILPEEQKFVITYLYLKGYTHSELAEEFNIPLGTVKTRLRMAMLHLRNHLNVS